MFYAIFEGYLAAIYIVAFSLDSKLIASGADNFKTVFLWDPAAAKDKIEAKHEASGEDRKEITILGFGNT